MNDASESVRESILARSDTQKLIVQVALVCGWWSLESVSEQ